MAYTLGEAARATGKDRATISRAIKKGKVSATKDEHGQWCIDPAELHRVYPAQQQADSARNTDDATPRNTDLAIENRELSLKLQAALEKIGGLEGDKAFLQSELSKATALLTDQREKSPPKASSEKPVSLWSRLLGRTA